MEFEEHLRKYLSEEEIRKLMDSLKNGHTKHALVLNREKMSPFDFEKEFPLLQKHPFINDVYLYDNDTYALGKHIYFFQGVYYLFEPCSPLVNYFLNPSEEDTVLDACAAPGGKTSHASLMMNNEGLILSNEISLERAYILSSNVERMGRKNIIVTSNNVNELHKKYKNTFTKIILDAPCSGSGMFRKEEKMKDDWTYGKVLSCAALQKELILLCFDMLKEGGTLVYSTCSFSYEEDEETILYLLSNKEDASLLPMEDAPYFYKSEKKIGIHLFPHLYFGEGHYICLIRKNGNLTKDIYKEKEDKYGLLKMKYNLKGYAYPNDNNIYLIPHNFDTKSLHVIRGGLKIGTEEKYGFEEDHALSHYLSSYSNKVNLNEEEMKKYLSGEALNTAADKGMCLLQYHNISLGWGKSSNGRINNKLPKGLRIR